MRQSIEQKKIELVFFVTAKSCPALPPVEIWNGSTVLCVEYYNRVRVEFYFIGYWQLQNSMKDIKFSLSCSSILSQDVICSPVLYGTFQFFFSQIHEFSIESKKRQKKTKTFNA